jgi:hypothetical protein
MGVGTIRTCKRGGDFANWRRCPSDKQAGQYQPCPETEPPQVLASAQLRHATNELLRLRRRNALASQDEFLRSGRPRSSPSSSPESPPHPPTPPPHLSLPLSALPSIFRLVAADNVAHVSAAGAAASAAAEEAPPPPAGPAAVTVRRRAPTCLAALPPVPILPCGPTARPILPCGGVAGPDGARSRSSRY